MKMENSIKLEEAAQFLLSIVLFAQLDYAWWVYLLLFLLPDLSMIGYLKNNEVGANLYNLFHHKLLAIAIYAIGLVLNNEPLILSGLILFGHSAFDRMLGYGLKYKDGFKHTHLGRIGKD